MDDVLYTGRTIRAALDALFDPWPSVARAASGADRPRPPRAAHRGQVVGRVVQTSDIEIIEVKFQEVDGMEKVLLVEKVV